MPLDNVFQQSFRFHPEWYESIERYQPSPDLLRIVRLLMPIEWTLDRKDMWFHAHPPGAIFPAQGWKIHVSATPANLEQVLCLTTTICVRRVTPFKFALDKETLSRSLDKGWNRESSGKFITIYPKNEQVFFDLMQELYIELRGFSGPYVLSDRRYKDSLVLYYRYGGILPSSEVNERGERELFLKTPTGEYYPDVRVPYWNPPPWIKDPFSPTEDEDATKPFLKDGRYRIEAALGFSPTGGVYVATDLDSGCTVVIKEARPFTGFDSNDTDALGRLRKEHRLLEELSNLRIVPRPLDLFQEWEHLFLVEEYIPGLDLARVIVNRNPLVHVYPDETSIAAYREWLLAIWRSLTRAVEQLHERNIVYGDLSLSNVIVLDEERAVIRLIDLETAWQEGKDDPIHMMTPGFSSPDQKAPSKEEDIYALGATMLATLFPMNPLLDVQPQAAQEFLNTLAKDLALPPAMREIVARCMSRDQAARPSARQVTIALTTCPAHSSDSPTYNYCEDLPGEDLQAVVSHILEYISASADPSRNDRLFPADPAVFMTNPLSVAYGVTGVAYALYRINDKVPNPVISWMLTRSLSPQDNPPGLYVGLAGVGWVLCELGLGELAEKLLCGAGRHDCLWRTADVFYGAAGYGLSCLRLYLDSGKNEWLDRAIEVGEQLLASKVEQDGESWCWPDRDGKVWLGYGRGSSGIALFLLYLSYACGDVRYLQAGRRALAFDLKRTQLVEWEGHPAHLSVPLGPLGSLQSRYIISHYWLDGSAGVCTTLVRYWVCTRDSVYKDYLDRLGRDCFRKIVSFPGLFRGLSGLGNFLLDGYMLTGSSRYLQEAYRVARGIMLFRLPRQHGIAFPGEQLMRISTDFGTGSAGIALFLNRLANAGETGKASDNFNFTLDRLLPDSCNDKYLIQVGEVDDDIYLR